MGDAKIKTDDLEKGELVNPPTPSKCCGFSKSNKTEKVAEPIVKEPSVSFFTLFRFADTSD
eukprot:CAMPEP_0204840416 /NCGR_PEP_ID=MMETSP1346-20131115/37718_1 /ASSEMBLY_ACC=CAM_ASM_000771 /TAXON_ID=215587 /ORGANISM="Aplanochytrium stocchinoi, Strain GSBS06" /LENGTH=60 /DNA_ID=CAMNT_0051977815 /DNA_START=29 /DNA_END=208 /DNA_ORIENTATION=-